MKKVLIVGSTGLLGSSLAKALKGKSEVIEASLGGKSQYQVDITDSNSLQSLFEKVGPVDAIVCTAGMVRFVPWNDVADSDWNHGIMNKLMGQVNVVRIGSSYVREGGSITLTTGMLAQYPIPGSSIVSTVNAAIEGFIRSAAMELGSKVRVNAVSPGWIEETLQAMNMDPKPGMPASQVAEVFIQQIESGASSSVAVAAKT